MLKQLRISFLAVVLPILLLLDGAISNIDGIILVSAFVVYSFWLVKRGRDGVLDKKDAVLLIIVYTLFIALVSSVEALGL